MTRILQKTIVMRKCLNCDGMIGIGIWPWSGRRFAVSHGLCPSCFDELEQAALALEPGAASGRRPAREEPRDEGWYTASGI